MGKLLVTGLGGFTGKYIKAAFEAAGHEVFGLVRSEGDRINSDDIVCDLTELESIRSALYGVPFDGVVHLAAVSFVAHANPIDFYAVNILGTQNLLDVLRETKIPLKKIILASSANVYGLAGGELAISEGFPIAPTNHYAISKAGMEFIASAYVKDLPILITRPFNYTGPGQGIQFLVSKIVSHYRQGKREIELGNLDVERDFSDVRDIAEMYRHLYESDVESGIFNLCSGKTYSIGEIISLMNEIAGYEIRVVVNQDFVRKDDIRILKGDNGSLEKAIGSRKPVDFRNTLSDMFRTP